MILNHTNANVIENICIVCDDINDKFCEHEDLNGDDDDVDDDNNNNNNNNNNNITIIMSLYHL